MKTSELDYNVGSQVPLSWPAGSAGQSDVLFSAGGFAGNYRLTITGSNVLVRVETGTSSTNVVERLTPPLRFVCSGPVLISATVVDDDEPASARVMVSRVTAGETPELREMVTGPVDLAASVVAFRALTACVLDVQGVAVSLLAGQGVEVCSPITLTSGSGTALHEI